MNQKKWNDQKLGCSTNKICIGQDKILVKVKRIKTFFNMSDFEVFLFCLN